MARSKCGTWRRAVRSAALTGHDGGVNAVAVTPDGRRAISASDDRTLKVWNLATGAEERTLTGHSDRVLSVAVTPDGRRVYLGGRCRSHAGMGSGDRRGKVHAGMIRRCGSGWQ